MVWISIKSNPGCHTERPASERVGFRRMGFYALLILLLFLSSAQAQLTREIEGKVFSMNGDVAGIHVMNISAQRATITNDNGYFKISAKLNDTLVFSAVQYKRKMITVNLAVLRSNFLNVYMEEGEIRLDEVFVMPYNLSGELSKDLDSLKIGPAITASSLSLPNADVKPPTQSERKLYTARTWDAHFYVIAAGTKLDPLINYFSGRTKMLKNRVARETADEKIQRTRNFYADSIFTQGLNIPKDKIFDFLFYCEVDSTFQNLVDSQDRFGIWKYLQEKSMIYRKVNKLE